MIAIYAQLHLDCAALGTRLFTITVQDNARDLCWRAYTSHPIEYPISGTKPLTRDGWFEACITAQKTFVANTTPEFAKFFFDHALISSLGLGSCVNIPVIDKGVVLGTINLLAEEGHFTPDRLVKYEALAAANQTAMITAMTQG